jgi:mono/diheme cytochrome c family protein
MHRSVRKGRVRNGAVYMPPFEGILQQEAVWAIKAYLETKSRQTLKRAAKAALVLSVAVYDSFN